MLGVLFAECEFSIQGLLVLWQKEIEQDAVWERVSFIPVLVDNISPTWRQERQNTQQITGIS